MTSEQWITTPTYLGALHNGREIFIYHLGGRFTCLLIRTETGENEYPPHLMGEASITLHQEVLNNPELYTPTMYVMESIKLLHQGE